MPPLAPEHYAPAYQSDGRCAVAASSTALIRQRECFRVTEAKLLSDRKDEGTTAGSSCA